jgi:hypothetical protein
MLGAMLVRILAVRVLCGLALASPVLQAAQTKLVVTAQENGVEPQAEMDCRETLHGYITLPHSYQGAHQLEGLWILPNGEMAGHSESTVDFRPPGASTAHVWFTFPDRGSLLTPINPTSDAERLRYSGPWELRILWDRRPLTQSTFRIRCL